MILRRGFSLQLSPRPFSFLIQKRLVSQSLFKKEKEALSRPRDPIPQAELYRSLNDHGLPHLVLSRIQTQKGIARDHFLILREWIKAFISVRTGGRASPSDVGITLDEMVSARKMTLVQDYGALIRQMNSLDGYPTFIKSAIVGTIRFFKSAIVFSIFLLGIATTFESGISTFVSSPEKKSSIVSDKKFSDVKGCREAKHELQEIVEFLKDPPKFTRLGGKLPKGVLLTGPPGTGKTLLAKAVAGEADVPFFYCSGSEFEEMFIGLGAKRVRELFAQAKKSTPCIIFIDEIDAIGGTRKEKDNQAMRMTLNQLLVELDGFESSEGIIIIGATNFPEMLDAALIRPGRFDREVGVPLPDVNDRKEIIEHYLSLVKASKEVDATVLARGTPGCSGADLSNIINIAAIESAVRNLPQVTQEILEFAKDKVLMGAERKSQVLSDKVKKITAFHEGGHAIMALFSEGSMPIHKATIIPRGQSLGMVMRLPEGDQFSKSKKELLADLDVAMGGRVAEELILGHDNVTTGASSDLHQASRIARAMVMAYGMSESLGPIDCSRNLKELSGETRQKIDEEVKKLLEASYTRAKNLLTSKHKELETLARSLLMYETLTGDEVRAIVDGKQIDKMIVNEIPWPMSE